MPGRRYTTAVTANTNVVTTTETVAATVVVPSVPGNNRRIQLTGFAQVTTGGSTTSLTFRIRRGTAITDPVVGEANAENVEAAAGSNEGHTIVAEDTPGDVANQSYVLTVQQTGAAADGTVLAAQIWADVDF